MRGTDRAEIAAVKNDYRIVMEESGERVSGDRMCRYGCEGLALVASDAYRGFLLNPAISSASHDGTWAFASVMADAAGSETALPSEQVGGLR